MAKVGKKVFAFLSPESADEAKITVKLPESREQALDLPGAVPTGYGLGRAGWVTIPIAVVPDGLAEDWIEESYRVVAPKKLSRQLDSQEPFRPRHLQEQQPR